jgi:uncharacterized protein YabN with tetrapyrrole methylase and pyrophosphatase domain
MKKRGRQTGKERFTIHASLCGRGDLLKAPGSVAPYLADRLFNLSNDTEGASTMTHTIEYKEDQKPFDIYIVGLGIMSIHHITREAEEAIKASKQVFFVDPGFGVREFLQTLCPKVTSLLDSYKEGEDRIHAYRAMAMNVVDAALEQSPISFATYGHPWVYVYPTFLIKRAAELLDLKVKIVPGISTFDTVIVDLGIDPGSHGFQMYEATDLLLKERPLQPDVPCLLWQVAAVETALFTNHRGNAERFMRLQQYLLKYYPAEHSVTLVLSSTFPLIDPLKETFPLNELARQLEKGLQSGTLYIPPLEERGIRNHSLLQQAYDQEHLKRISSSS